MNARGHFSIFSSSSPPPPPPLLGPRYSVLHLPFESPSLPLPHLAARSLSLKKNLLCRLLFLPFSFLTCLKHPQHQTCLYSWKFSRRSHCPFRIIILFNADYHTPRQYELRIRNPCIPTGIAVNFTAHTLWRATLFPQLTSKSKKKNLPFFPPLFFFFFFFFFFF